MAKITAPDRKTVMTDALLDGAVDAVKNGKTAMTLDDIIYLDRVKNRQIFISEEIDILSIEEACSRILRYNKDDAGLPVDQRPPIYIYIDSPGGEVDAGFKLVDLILASETEVRVICCGYCYSMAFMIFLAGHKRYATENAKFLLHDGAMFAGDSMAKLRDRIEFDTRVESRVKAFVIQHSKITPEQYDENYRKEWYMFADEAKRNGVVDYVIGKDCGIEEIA